MFANLYANRWSKYVQILHIQIIHLSSTKFWISEHLTDTFCLNPIRCFSFLTVMNVTEIYPQAWWSLSLGDPNKSNKGARKQLGPNPLGDYGVLWYWRGEYPRCSLSWIEMKWTLTTADAFWKCTLTGWSVRWLGKRETLFTGQFYKLKNSRVVNYDRKVHYKKRQKYFWRKITKVSESWLIRMSTFDRFDLKRYEKGQRTVN